ncbi:hypothetical protein RUR49_19245 [Pseudoxanthobacter sp. M-2]|uniref:hypothetical protein n=1 Tax=Pseudoxanthobacter sp. M-2 TaxID=3078754 RepID=UPI0038FD3944
MIERGAKLRRRAQPAVYGEPRETHRGVLAAMSGIAWSPYRAVARLAVVLGFLGGSVPYGATAADERNGQSVLAQAGASLRDAKRTGLLNEAESAPYSVNYEKACSDPSSREEADLCQQWRNAEAASQLVEQAHLQIRLSLLEGALLVLTVFFTGWAAVAASRAAKSAQSAVNVAITATRLQRTTDRPYLVPTGAYPEIISSGSPQHEIALRMNILNVGRGPAIFTGFGVTSEIGASATGTCPLRSGEMKGRWFIREDSTRTFSVPFAYVLFSGEQYDRLMQNKVNLYFYGYLRYVDMFKVARRTSFCLEFVPKQKDLLTAGVFVQSGDSNLWYDEEESEEYGG